MAEAFRATAGADEEARAGANDDAGLVHRLPGEKGEMDFWKDVTGDLPWVTHAHMKVVAGQQRETELASRSAT